MELSELRPYIDLIRSYPYKKQELSDLETQISNAQIELTAVCKKIEEYNKRNSNAFTKLFNNTKKLEILNQQKSEHEAILKELNMRRDELKGIIDYIFGLKTQLEKLLIIRENEFRGDIYHPAFPRFLETDTKIEESKALISKINKVLDNINGMQKINSELVNKLNDQIVEYKRNLQHDFNKNLPEYILTNENSGNPDNGMFIEYDYIKDINNQFIYIDNSLEDLKLEIKEIKFEINIEPINSNILIKLNFTKCLSNNEIFEKYQKKLSAIIQNLSDISISLKSTQDEQNKLIEQLTIEKEDILINA